MRDEYRDIHSIMVENAKRFGDKIYIVSVDDKEQVTYSQINQYSDMVADFLRDNGVKKDDKVNLIGHNSIKTIIMFFGVLKYGAIISPVNVEESRENIYRIIDRVKPRFVFYDEKMNLDHSNSPYSWIPFGNFHMEEKRGNDFFPGIVERDSVYQIPAGNREDIAEILFTSGTTELPKGVAISREGLFYMVDEVVKKMGMTRDDRILEYRAYSWASTLLTSIFSSMFSGATLYLAKKFSRSRFAHWLKVYDVTISTGVPAVINMLVTDPVELRKEDVPSLKFMTSSSAPLRIERHRAFESIYGIPINQMAGMSEAGWMSGNPPEKRKMGSVGTPLVHKELRVVDERGRECDSGVEGEIVVRGRSIGIGYLNEQGGVDRFPGEWFHTGDFGYIDLEGYVFITGRKKDLIIRGGVNISPMEITTRLMEHPHVKEAVTLGIPDEIYGEEIASFIVAKPGHKIEEKNILDHCKKKLPDFKLPKVIHFLDEIPTSARGKAAKETLLCLLEESDSAARNK